MGSVAASEGTTLSRTMSAGKLTMEYNRQLVIGVNRMEEGAVEKVANTEAAKQTTKQGMSDVERLSRAMVKNIRVWRANDSTSVIKLSVEKDKEAALRQTTAE